MSLSSADSADVKHTLEEGKNWGDSAGSSRSVRKAQDSQQPPRKLNGWSSASEHQVGRTNLNGLALLDVAHCCPQVASLTSY